MTVIPQDTLLSVVSGWQVTPRSSCPDAFLLSFFFWLGGLGRTQPARSVCALSLSRHGTWLGLLVSKTAMRLAPGLGDADTGAGPLGPWDSSLCGFSSVVTSRWLDCFAWQLRAPAASVAPGASLIKLEKARSTSPAALRLSRWSQRPTQVQVEGQTLPPLGRNARCFVVMFQDLTYQFPRAAVIRHHKLRGLKSHPFVIVLEVRSSKWVSSMCSQEFMEFLGESPFFCCP